MVVVGSALMVALNGMSKGQQNFLNKQLNFLAPNILFVSSGQRGFRGGPQGPPTIIINNEVVNRIKSLPFVQEAVPSYQGQLEMNARGNILNAQVMALNPQKIYLVNPSLQLVDGSSIQANNPSAMLVGDTIANPAGMSTPFVSVGSTVKASFTYIDPKTGKAKEESKSFVISGIIQPTGNNQIDRSVIINEASGNSLFHKAGKYDQMVVAALSGDYVNVVQQEITSLYGNNIGVITPKAILQTRQQFQSGNSSFTLAIAFIALLVGAVGIITTLYTSVSERTKEIGTMKAIGAKSKFILTLFLSEALLIGILGSTLGILTGIGGALCSDFWFCSKFTWRRRRRRTARSNSSSYHSRICTKRSFFCMDHFSTFEFGRWSISCLESITTVSFRSIEKIARLLITHRYDKRKPFVLINSMTCICNATGRKCCISNHLIFYYAVIALSTFVS